jgi:hypothetical protein
MTVAFDIRLSAHGSRRGKKVRRLEVEKVGKVEGRGLKVEGVRNRYSAFGVR